MEKHGSESYFVLGEGLLGESGEGRTLAGAVEARRRRSGSRAWGRGHRAPARRGEPQEARRARWPRAAAEPSQIPAGFTYLGQFIDHDLTFDKTNVMLGAHVTADRSCCRRARPASTSTRCTAPARRTPSRRSSTRPTACTSRPARRTAIDGIPPSTASTSRAARARPQKAKRKAIIPDPRNDENLAVAQTHLAMIRFHNRVRRQPARRAPGRPALRHGPRAGHQALPVDDPARTSCRGSAGRRVVNNVFTHGRKVFEVGRHPDRRPHHADRVLRRRLPARALDGPRARYNWNKIFDDGGGTLDLLFTFSGTERQPRRRPAAAEQLDRRLPPPLRLRRGRPRQPGRAGEQVQPRDGDRHRTSSTRSRNLPPATFGGSGVPGGDPQRNLAFRNLTRARMVRLATGQQMATFLKGKGVNSTALTKAQIRDGKGGAELDDAHADAARRAADEHAAVVLHPARGGAQQRPAAAACGARIVAETFHRAMEGSAASIVRDPAWRPTLGPDDTTFRMVDLLLFAFEGKKTLLAPLG